MHERGPHRGTFAKPLAERPANGDGPNVTRTQAKELFNVSRYKIDVASYVHNHNSDLATKVHQGDIALKNAYRQVKSQEEKTKIALTKPPIGTYQVIVIETKDELIDGYSQSRRKSEQETVRRGSQIRQRTHKGEKPSGQLSERFYARRNP